MPDPIKWKSTIILAKIESVYGSNPTPTGAANAMLMTDVELLPMEGEDVSRNLERPYLGAQETFSVGLRAVLTGSTELVGSGSTGVAPKWSPLARASGLAEVVTPDDDPGDGTVVYSPITDSHESITVYMWKGATRHVLLGARGTAVITVNAQGIPVARWTLTGLWSQPSEQSRPTPVFTGWQAPVVATKTNTPTFAIGGVNFVMRSCSLNLGNDVQPRLLVGREEIRIVDRAEEIAATVEAVPLSTFDPFSSAVSLSHKAFSLVHGVTAGYKTAIAAATCAVKRLTGYENQQNILEWPLRLTPLPTDGDDQFSITLT